MTKTEIIDHIHTLVSNNVLGNKQLMSRYKGFRGELFLETFLKDKYPSRKYFDGGMIISKNSSKTSLDNAMYICIIARNEYTTDYLEIFARLSLIGFEKIILVLYEEDNYEMKPVMIYPSYQINLPVPDMTVYHFSTVDKKFMQPSKDISDVLNFFEINSIRTSKANGAEEAASQWLHQNLEEFSQSQLLKIYMNRLFMDGFIGFGKKKGKPSDIDMIIKNISGKYSLIEVKEKDLPKRSKKGFGLDEPRLKDFLRISEQTGLDYYLVVRHINSQSDRELVGYKYISIQDFAEDVEGSETVIGGTGMRGITTANETKICGYDLFHDL
jgi:hypothetical protein